MIKTNNKRRRFGVENPDYGYLNRLDVEGLQAGSRVNIGDKRNATDFALWKFSPKDKVWQMEWEHPWV